MFQISNDFFFYLNLATKPVDPGVPPKYTLRRDRELGLTDTWRQWAEAREVEEWIQSVAGVLEQGWNDQSVFFYSKNFVSPF
jgi:hypothetical protein